MNKPIFSKYSNRGLDKYSIVTTIHDNNGTLLATKSPLNKDAEEHIKSLAKKYVLLSDSGLSKSMSIVGPISESPDAFTVNVVEGETLEHKLFSALTQADLDSVMVLLEKFFGVLKSMKISEDMKHDKTHRLYEGTSHPWLNGYIYPGIIDMNFDNVVIDPNQSWHLIDYEWCEDYPIPLDYVMGRSLYWFFSRATEAMKLLSQRYDCVEISGALIVPKDVYQKYRNIFSILEHVMALENNFQSIVHGNHVPKVICSNTIKKYTYLPALLSDMYRELNEAYIKSLTHIRNVEASNLALTQNLDSIVNSRSYKAINRIKSVKNLRKTPNH